MRRALAARITRLEAATMPSRWSQDFPTVIAELMHQAEEQFHTTGWEATAIASQLALATISGRAAWAAERELTDEEWTATREAHNATLSSAWLRFFQPMYGRTH